MVVDWIGKLITAHFIEEALRKEKADEKLASHRLGYILKR